jgi:hypothetical protein
MFTATVGVKNAASFQRAALATHAATALLKNVGNFVLQIAANIRETSRI